MSSWRGIYNSNPGSRLLASYKILPLNLFLPQNDSRNDPTSFILSDLELSPENEHLFDNLHEELGAPDWLDL
jgi:hypothetical protein